MMFKSTGKSSRRMESHNERKIWSRVSSLMENGDRLSMYEGEMVLKDGSFNYCF